MPESVPEHWAHFLCVALVTANTSSTALQSWIDFSAPRIGWVLFLGGESVGTLQWAMMRNFPWALILCFVKQTSQGLWYMKEQPMGGQQSGFGACHGKAILAVTHCDQPKLYCTFERAEQSPSKKLADCQLRVVQHGSHCTCIEYVWCPFVPGCRQGSCRREVCILRKGSNVVLFCASTWCLLVVSSSNAPSAALCKTMVLLSMLLQLVLNSSVLLWWCTYPFE